MTRIIRLGALAAFAALTVVAAPAAAQQPQPKPNIVVIMGDDIGIWNIGAYHRGMMSGRTPNLDKIAAEGLVFTDYYAEASCTAGRANFITGELPIRTGLTTVGQAGSTLGMPDEAPTIATVLKSMGYATGQFGKNHLGDLNQFLPTLHGFDEFFGYLYHLDAMEDPCHPNYPPALKETVGPRHMLHCQPRSTALDDPPAHGPHLIMVQCACQRQEGQGGGSQKHLWTGKKNPAERRLAGFCSFIREKANALHATISLHDRFSIPEKYVGRFAASALNTVAFESSSESSQRLDRWKRRASRSRSGLSWSRRGR